MFYIFCHLLLILHLVRTITIVQCTCLLCLEITYRVSGIPTEVVTASNGSTIWSDRKYFITKMPEELVNSTLFQPTHRVDISTIEIFSVHKAMIYVGVFESKDGGLMEVLPKLGWKLEDGWFVEWNNGPKERLHKIWSLQIEAGQSITFTTTKKDMTFAIFIAKAAEGIHFAN